MLVYKMTSQGFNHLMSEISGRVCDERDYPVCLGLSGVPGIIGCAWDYPVCLRLSGCA